MDRLGRFAVGIVCLCTCRRLTGGRRIGGLIPFRLSATGHYAREQSRPNCPTTASHWLRLLIVLRSVSPRALVSVAVPGGFARSTIHAGARGPPPKRGAESLRKRCAGQDEWQTGNAGDFADL